MTLIFDMETGEREESNVIQFPPRKEVVSAQKQLEREYSYARRPRSHDDEGPEAA